MPKSSNTITMDDLLAGSELKQLETGDVVEGSISSVRKHQVWIDLGPRGVGVVMRREVGRVQYQFMPFAGTDNSGNFKSNPFQQQQSFMQSQYSLQGETYFYGKTDFEPSPLNRTLKVMAPGNSWVGSGRGVEMKYWINTNA